MKMAEFEEPPAEISSDAHHAHALKLVTTDGCREPGSGKGRRYRCSVGWDCDLHVVCALAEPLLKHPLFGDDLEFQPLPEAPPPVDKKFCDACGFQAPGLVYHCFAMDLDLHPTCAAIKMESAFLGDHRVQLRWESDDHCCVACSGGDKRSSSSRSGKKFWVYRWVYNGARGYLHRACMKRIAFQSWKQTYQASIGGGLVGASIPTMTTLLQRKHTDGNGLGLRGYPQVSGPGVWGPRVSDPWVWVSDSCKWFFMFGY